jgi:GT2 family glycosyltransferase
VTNARPTISAIVLTYKRPDELDGVLENLLGQLRQPDEILVFDNDPEQSGRAAARVADPRVRYICPGENLGVTGGRNAAVTYAQGEILLFIDDDARFDSPSAMATILDAFAADDVAVLAFLIRNAETKEIVPREYPGYTLRQVAEPHDVSYFLGGACAMRRAAFAMLGGYDDALFYGGEEVEFSFRLLRQGLRIRYLPDVLVYHRASPKGREKVQDAYRLIRNRVYIAIKHMPLPYLLTHLAIWGGFAFLQALRARQPGEYVRGLASVKADGLLAKALAYRRANPMRRETVAYLRRHEGRLIY